MCVLEPVTAAEWHNITLYGTEVLNNFVADDVSFFHNLLVQLVSCIGP